VAEDDAGPSAALSPLARARLDDLLGEVLTRVGDVLDTQERLRGLLDAVVGINADLSLERALERIVTSACDLVGARYGALGVLGAGPGRRLREFVTAGLTPEERTAIGDLPRGHGILGVIIDRPEPLRLPVLGENPSSYGFPPNHPPMRTFLGVPIRIRDRIFGNLYLTEKRGGEQFTAEDEGVVVALAAAAGVVIENARLYEETVLRQRWLEAAAPCWLDRCRAPTRPPSCSPRRTAGCESSPSTGCPRTTCSAPRWTSGAPTWPTCSETVDRWSSCPTSRATTGCRTNWSARTARCSSCRCAPR
jgi:hypothetical protein